MTSHYNRSEIYSFCELPDEQQEELLGSNPDSGDMQRLEDTTFVICGNDALPLNMFMRMDNSKIWHGVYGQTAFSVYFIRIDSTNSEALIAYRHF